MVLGMKRLVVHIHIKRLDKVFIQLLDRHIRHMVSLFQELTEYPAGVPVLVERACRPIHPTRRA